MSTKQKGPWAWRLRDLKGEPGPWHMAEHQRPAIAGGDNIEILSIPAMVEKIGRLEREAASAEGSAMVRKLWLEKTNDMRLEVQAQRDELLGVIKEAHEDLCIGQHMNEQAAMAESIDRADRIICAAIAKATP